MYAMKFLSKRRSYLLMFITCLYATGMPILTWFAFFGFT